MIIRYVDIGVIVADHSLSFLSIIYVRYLVNVEFFCNRIGGVVVSVFASSAVGRGFEPRSDQTKDYEIAICCFSAKYAALRRKRIDWSAYNQNNVSE